jgi:lipopolysaccharide transport system ATP-binding protein
VDEVLAVGDVAFQKKCLGKMEDVGKEGRTVLFVSHQMSAIEKLCSRAIVLRSGTIKFAGDKKSAINFYLKDLDDQVKQIKTIDISRSGTGELRLTGFSIEDSVGNNLIAVACGEDIVLVFHYALRTDKPLKNISIGFSIHNALEDSLSVLYSDYAGTTFSLLPPVGKFKCMIRDFPYSTGRYLVGARVLANGLEVDWPRGYIGYIDVEAGDFYRTGSIGHSGIGPVLIRGDWELEVA